MLNRNNVLILFSCILFFGLFVLAVIPDRDKAKAGTSSSALIQTQDGISVRITSGEFFKIIVLSYGKKIPRVYCVDGFEYDGITPVAMFASRRHRGLEDPSEKFALDYVVQALAQGEIVMIKKGTPEDGLAKIQYFPADWPN